jgi:hypothetical protein
MISALQGNNPVLCTYGTYEYKMQRLSEQGMHFSFTALLFAFNGGRGEGKEKFYVLQSSHAVCPKNIT